MQYLDWLTDVLQCLQSFATCPLALLGAGAGTAALLLGILSDLLGGVR